MMESIYELYKSTRIAFVSVIITFTLTTTINPNEAISSVGLEILWYKNKLRDYSMKGNPTYAQFHPNGKTFFIGSKYDTLIREVSVNTGEIIRKFDSSLRAVSFSIDGKSFYTYRLLKIDYETLDTIGEFGADLKKNFKTMSFAANERAGLAIITSNSYPQRLSSDSSIYIYDINNFVLKKVTSIADRYITNVIIPEGGNRFFILSYSDPDSSVKGDEKKYVSVWDINTLEMKIEENITLENWNTSGNGNYLINQTGNTYYIYDCNNLKIQYQWHICNDMMFWAIPSMTYDGKYFVTGAFQGSNSFYRPRIWYTTTGICINELDDYYFNEESVIATAINSRNQLLIMGHNCVYLYNTNIVSAQEYCAEVYNILFSNSSGELCIELKNEAVQRLSVSLYDYMGREIIGNIENRAGERSISKDLSFLPAGAYFLRLQIDGQNYTEKFIKE